MTTEDTNGFATYLLPAPLAACSTRDVTRRDLRGPPPIINVTRQVQGMRDLDR